MWAKQGIMARVEPSLSEALRAALNDVGKQLLDHFEVGATDDDEVAQWLEDMLGSDRVEDQRS